VPVARTSDGVVELSRNAKLNSQKITLLVRKMFPTSKDGTLFGGSVSSKSTGFGSNTQSPFQSQPGSGGAFSNTFQATSNGSLSAPFGGTTPNQSASLSAPFSGTTPNQSASLSAPFSGTTPNQSASLSAPFSGSSTQPGGLSTPFGGAPVTTQPSASAETTRTLQLVEKLTSDLAALTQKFDTAVAAAQVKPVDRVYVACSLHPHVLLETTASGTEYAAGYTCDICQVTYQNREERFYQCASCPSPTGRGKLDVCAACVKKQLAK
jgi:hypothetical protein